MWLQVAEEIKTVTYAMWERRFFWFFFMCIFSSSSSHLIEFKLVQMLLLFLNQYLFPCVLTPQGAFPPPCGPESLFSLLDERSLLKYAKGSNFPEQGSPFRYFVIDNSIIIGLLEQPLGNVEGQGCLKLSGGWFLLLSVFFFFFFFFFFLIRSITPSSSACWSSRSATWKVRVVWSFLGVGFCFFQSSSSSSSSVAL